MSNVKVKINSKKAIDKKDIEERVEASCKALVEEIQQSLDKPGKPGTGRVYVRDGKMHRASTPGQPPAKDTGTLGESIEYKVTEEGYDVVGLVGSTADYAIYLEFGTSKMAARPFLRPVLENKKKEIVDKFVEGGK